jgi:hypothetical protein
MTRRQPTLRLPRPWLCSGRSLAEARPRAGSAEAARPSCWQADRRACLGSQSGRPRSMNSLARSTTTGTIEMRRIRPSGQRHTAGLLRTQSPADGHARLGNHKRPDVGRTELRDPQRSCEGRGMHQESRLGGRVSQRAALVLGCLLLAACGGRSVDSASGNQSARSGSVARTPSTTTPHSPALAPRVCGRAASAARSRVRVVVAMRIADADPAYLECILDGRGFHVDVVAQAIAQALGDYDTTLVHQVQTYVEPPPANGIRDRSQLPHPISGIGTKAAWIPGQQRLLATNGTPVRGGNFLSVTVTGRSPSGPARLALARAIAAATLAVAPRGPNLPSEH